MPVIIIAGFGFLLRKRVDISAKDLIKLATNLPIPALVFDQLLSTKNCPSGGSPDLGCLCDRLPGSPIHKLEYY